MDLYKFVQRKVEPPNSPGKRLRSWTICALQDVYVDAPIVRQSCAMHSHDVAAGTMAAKFATPYLITLQWTGKACLVLGACQRPSIRFRSCLPSLSTKTAITS